MSDWVTIFLGVIALGSLTQMAVLVLLFLESRKAVRRLDALQLRVEKDLRPALEGLARISRNLAEVSDLAVLEARRVDVAVADVIDQFQELTRDIRSTLVRPLGPLVDILAFVKGVQRGIQVYRQLGGFDARERGAHRHYAEEDEHLFI